MTQIIKSLFYFFTIFFRVIHWNSKNVLMKINYLKINKCYRLNVILPRSDTTMVFSNYSISWELSKQFKVFRAIYLSNSGTFYQPSLTFDLQKKPVRNKCSLFFASRTLIYSCMTGLTQQKRWHAEWREKWHTDTQNEGKINK